MTAGPTATGAFRYVAFLPCTPSVKDLAGDFISSVLATWGTCTLPADRQAVLCEFLTNAVDNSSSPTLRIVLDRFPDNVVQIHIDSPSNGRAPTTLTRPAKLPGKVGETTRERRNLIMTVPAPTTPLTPAERRVAQHLVRGVTPQSIAAGTGLSAATIRQYVREMREKLHCPPRCPLPVLVHALLVSGETTPPPTDRPAPELNPAEQKLLRAIVEQSTTAGIALAAGIAPADYRSALDALLDTAGAADATELVVLAHAWNVIRTGQEAPAPNGADR
ncbi:hypothetical protein GCM10010377_75830 [Streptomyces viridiviolaceus]|uniref:Helix-turn-helix transcriptional regulator n=1 Tax=Streptomyces viridiviolaceus TaxID=68282 RepID=A0ABW2DVB6_9ACTN|nr:LuxR C-terminal-related transcriptional regulator [Streptomyces viridiviolaceus]GHB74267.1 hypothetical protein GCM10010377_75830 [Streptomyces viridiviolaceus]